jgi:hypothetical protein
MPLSDPPPGLRGQNSRAGPREVDDIGVIKPAPVVLAYGVGVDSTALLIELVARGEVCGESISSYPIGGLMRH